MKKIIVIGGLSAGPSAAAKARREDESAEIILFEKGANISYATCGMPYAFSGVIEDRSNLIVVQPELLRTRFNIEVRLNEEIVKIDTTSKVVYSKKGDYSYDTLVFATGAKSIVPSIKNIENRLQLMCDTKRKEKLINTEHIYDDFNKLVGSKVILKIPLIKI